MDGQASVVNFWGSNPNPYLVESTDTDEDLGTCLFQPSGIFHLLKAKTNLYPYWFIRFIPVCQFEFLQLIRFLDSFEFALIFLFSADITDSKNLEDFERAINNDWAYEFFTSNHFI